MDWVPDETFESGLKKTVEWYIKNRQWWGRVLSREKDGAGKSKDFS